MRTINQILTGINRPEPEEITNVSEDEIIAAAIANPKCLGVENQTEAKEVVETMLNSVRLAEAAELLPYMKQLVDIIKRDYSDYTTLFAARDAEPFYDAMKTVSAKDVYLFPGSKHLMSNLVSHSPDTQRKFLSGYGIHKGVEKVLIYDTGFKGTIGILLQEVLNQSYEKPAKVNIGLVSRDPDDNPGQELIKFAISEREAKQKFPLTFDYTKWPVCTSHSDNFHLGVALQSLPKFHGSFLRLMRDQTIEREPSRISWDLDKARGIDPSYCNPLAALIIQKRVIDYFSER